MNELFLNHFELTLSLVINNAVYLITKVLIVIKEEKLLSSGVRPVSLVFFMLSNVLEDFFAMKECNDEDEKDADGG